MSRIDTLDKATSALGTGIKLLRLLVTHVTPEKLQEPITSRSKRGNLIEFLSAGCPKVTYSPEGNTAVVQAQNRYDEAKRILGGDLISPEEVMAARPGIVYDEAQLKALAASIPSADMLQQLKQEGKALMPQPPHAISMLNVRALESGLFYAKTGGWYANQDFANNDKTGSRWIAVKKTPVDGSTSKTWAEQNKLLQDGEIVPNVAKMSWFVTTFFKVRGVRLFENVYVRTSSLVSVGGRVVVGYFDARGLGVGHRWVDYRISSLGLSASREF